MLRPPGVAGTEPPSRRLRLGEFELDLDARELLRPGARRGKRITAKAQQVLLELALRPGEVLSRDALMDAVWPDSYPTGDVLTQAIVLLRRCLDEEGAGHSAIETIAKSGYRLLLPVAWLDDTGTGEPVLLVGPPPPRAGAAGSPPGLPGRRAPGPPPRRPPTGWRRWRHGTGTARSGRTAVPPAPGTGSAPAPPSARG